MTKVKITANDDGETSGMAGRQKASDVGANFRINPYLSGKSLNPEDCPDSMVPMMASADIRVGCTTGRVYVFCKGMINFVHKADENTCAGRGAVLQDAKALELLAQAKADAEELAEHRAAKAAEEAAKKAAEEAAKKAAEEAAKKVVKK